ncbi:peptidoglycan-binding protein [Deinococcus sp. KSM4-11]|uniref:peptidoglycan-binding domain-containing protein n=1 Tax=Deinococcus sp. KSM4-11 TaxID=2568654 RepID=UPI0010A349A2|nr:peptidoglycan-binding protein [Deinococcus sp. KSM4-11]THF83624.1 peptidoglycan-binding protein [Deinococcus sp. KSM4-11]
MRFPAALQCALLGVLLASPAWAAPAGPDVERVAVRAAQALDGVLRSCPASFSKIGTDAKACVGVGGTVEEVRVTLGAAFSGELYGVWRSRDGQVSVFNWVATTAGHVYLRVQPDPDGRAQSLVYLDVPPDSSGSASPGSGTQLGSVTLTPVPGSAGSPAADPASTVPQAPAGTPDAGTAPVAADKAGAPVPFRRTLGVATPRMSGPDVLAVQNRLISLMRPARPGRGDGWFGPVTAATVRAFQGANGLPVTGKVDRATWDALFSASARPYTPPKTS